ncbi:bifunctional phosphopantothenoylcysteine decarboxylase/phosphopantothenate--cysteine ligase CoaBC [Lottiidibacillus patelloidae]|uniref:Coenzyme A biosynthesis bifunctional protein CoaBC n=1 Tax=Lottiidibacillus patelloidae TaxID=2670334 RepID=A0A263BYM5_9BACI|nr:bifunctional phosphopantothenoylcysteine decarboxylase/phosphopantothenate--cysteine ligase CoaBC [Lottiidibacillus patelloidae]OZM58760.1 bifunctional phosphopantothenoylcysteine decarboxylase/phosphopantothenate--cysteine ligase CoaBC [Lottiidibacillus patelloidae]
MMLNKKILLCVTGGIAVFKAAALTSKLTQLGASVKVIMTDSAKQFVTPLTFQALSRNPVYTDTFDEKDSEKIAHIDLADWADVVLVAPATANSIGKLANGIADDMVSTTILATTSDVWIAPAMNVHMYAHPAVQKNMDTLKAFGYRFIEPGIGQLACGYEGKGRLAEPEDIISILENEYNQTKVLKDLHIVVTAGPTEEKIDPVRYFTNRSSGKMGYAVAEEARKLGAKVTLISGPTNIQNPSGVEVIHVKSAQEMYEAANSVFNECSIYISAAAVADYRPKTTSEQKIKKQNGEWAIEMERTTDILATLGNKKDKQTVVGFAAESENVEQYALKKIEKKNLDMIVANNITSEGAGFGVDTNIVSIYKKDGSKEDLPMMSKNEVAKTILHHAHSLHVRNEQK